MSFVGSAWLLAQELFGKLVAHAVVSFSAVEEGESIFESADELCRVYFGAILGGIVAAFLQGLSPSIAKAELGQVVVVVVVVVVAVWVVVVVGACWGGQCFSDCWAAEQVFGDDA